MHPNFLYGKILHDGRPNFLTEYELSYKNCNFGVAEHGKCFIDSPFGRDINLGHLYTISRNNENTKEERMYDEPYTGDLPRRSWLCCPGSHQHIESEQPPMLENSNNSPSTPSEAITKAPNHSFCSGICERLQQQLDEQAQRYEEQLTELHSVIAELTRKLHQQRTLAIAEEDEISESCTSIHEDSVTCPLEVSELEPLDNELSDLDNKIVLSESPLELPEPKLTNSQHHEHNEHCPLSDIIEPLKQEITHLRLQLQEANNKLVNYQNVTGDEETVTENKAIESPESHIEIDCDPKLYADENKTDIKYSNIVPIHRTNIKINATTSTITPITKVAERIKLKRATDCCRNDVNPNDLINSDLPTAVAEHIVGDILRQCDVQNEKQAFYLEFGRLNAKLEHVKSQNSVLAITLSETKAHCDRLVLLCGKYESNAIALRLALGLTDRAIEAYDVLLALLETELVLNENDEMSIQNRQAAETVAKKLLMHLDNYKSTEILLSPWQNHVYSTPITDNNDEIWSSDHETRLREHVSHLKAERSSIQGTYVALESTHVENQPLRPSSSQEARKMDLEMAVLLQELMSLREDKAELLAKHFILEKDKSSLELKLKYMEGQHKAQTATLKNLQGQLKDTEALLALATQNKERGYSDAEHAQGVELELMQALAREARLKIRLQELVATLEQVTKNAEARILEGGEIVRDLNHTNSLLIERNSKKSHHYKYKDTEHYMMSMIEKQHKLSNLEDNENVQKSKKSNIKIKENEHVLTTLNKQPQKTQIIETPLTNSSDNSRSSLVT